MAEKEVKTAENKSFPKFLKWSLLFILVVVLDVGAVVASVYLTESRAKNNVARQEDALSQIAEQNNRISALERFAPAIAENQQNIIALSRTLNMTSDNLSQLQQDVADYKIEEITPHLDKLSHRIESLEETGNNEALILSLALIIKENSMYNRNFVKEADILSQLAGDNAALKEDVEIIKSFALKKVKDSIELVNEYNGFIKDFTFTPIQSEPEENSSAGAKLLKDTVSNLNLNKIIVLKKEKKTQHQKELLNTLTTYVRDYDFAKALDFIRENQEFVNANYEPLNAWQQAVDEKLTLDKAISDIIVNQLSALRKDFNTGDIVINNEPVNEEPALNVIDSQEDAALPTEEVVND